MTKSMHCWTELFREKIFEQFGRGIERRRYRLPDNREADFILKSGSDSVACLALTRDRQVILVRQFRPGPAKILLEIPGGGKLAEESPIVAAERELLEETGYQGEMRYVGSVIPCAYALYTKHFLVATNCDKVREPQVEDNGEELEVVLLTLDDFRSHIRTGQMTDVEGAYLCLDYLGLL
jgi:ADP-ribose pyrophosphatase